jgi:hypothetical protein
MASVLVQSEFVYRSGTPPEVYQFTIVSDQTGLISMRDLQDRYGFVISPYTQIPSSVLDDISAAQSQVEALLALTSAVNGTLTFAAEASKSVTFATPFPDTSYRVYVTSDIFAPFRITGKTTTGFTIEAGATVSGSVGYDVLV